MLNRSTLTQQAISGGHTYQSGGDMNVYQLPPQQAPEISMFFEQEIRDTIIFFKESLNELSDLPFPDNKVITIEEKNELNNLSKEYFIYIQQNSLSYFGKIRNFLENPRNKYYLDMYLSTAHDLQLIIAGKRHMYPIFDEMFTYLFSLFYEKCQQDIKLKQNRLHIPIFIHFMYYNCDIGIKHSSEI